MREDQDAERARRLDEAGRGDRLAGRGRMAEAVAADRAGVGARVRLVILASSSSTSSAESSTGSSSSSASLRRPRRRRVAVPVRLRFLLVRRDQLGEHAGERVDLVAAQLGAGGEVRRVLGEHALEPEHQAVPHLPPGRRRAAPASISARASSSARRREVPGARTLAGILALAEEGLARPGFGSEGGGHQAVRRLRRGGRLLFDLLHGRSV